MWYASGILLNIDGFANSKFKQTVFREKLGIADAHLKPMIVPKHRERRLKA